MNRKPTLSLTTDSDCTFILDKVPQLQMLVGLQSAISLSPGNHTLEFVSLDNPGVCLSKEFKMPEKDIAYEVKFNGKSKKIKKVTKWRKVWKIILWIIFTMAVVAAAVLAWDISQRLKPASVTRMANGDMKITVKGVSFVMKPVEGGVFQMGTNNGDEFAGEGPVHSVAVRGFYMGETEVTQVLWKRLMGYNPALPPGRNNPVNKVSWYDCQEFIRRLNQETGLNFRLPTEAEWEYAARGGKHRNGYRYAGGDDLDLVAWHDGYVHQVKKKRPNALGLYDMSGNVSEWCEDWFDYRYYSVSPAKNPQGPVSGTARVMRGGSYDERFFPVYSRKNSDPSVCAYQYGFRLAMSPTEK